MTRKEAPLIAAIVVGAVAFTGCERTRQPDPVLVSLQQAQADIQGAVSVGVNYLDFGHKLQGLSSAVILARRLGAAPDLVRPYEQALEMYEDGYSLWQMKIQCPSAFNDAFPECSVARQVGALAAKYGVPFDPRPPLSRRREQSIQEMAAMNIYHHKLKRDRLAEIRERDVHELENKYGEQQATREVYGQLVTAIWRKAAGTTAGTSSR